MTLIRTLDEMERMTIMEVIAHFQGNRTKTAQTLGISLRNLRLKLARYRALGFHVPEHGNSLNQRKRMEALNAHEQTQDVTDPA